MRRSGDFTLREELMAITLYDASPSANSDRVKIVLHEKGFA
jgi:hypothetical protein